VQGSSNQLPTTEGGVASDAWTTSPPAPSPDLAVANWTSNRIVNPGLEEYISDDPRWPRGWGAYATGDRYQWLATALTGHVSEGTYSGGLQSRARYGYDSYSYIYQTSIAADLRNLTLDFDWYVENPAFNSSRFYIQVTLWGGDSWRYVYYGLNGSTTGWGNSSYTGYYCFSGPTQQWNSFTRNLTADYLAIPAFPKTAPAGAQLGDFYFWTYSATETSQYLSAFVDDIHLKNGTTTYIGGSTRNGNFETGSILPWYSPGFHDASDIRRSPAAHSGTWSLNMTAASRGNYSTAYAYAPPYSRISTYNQGTLRFWWQLTYQNPTEQSQSYLYMYGYNGTQYQYLYYVLGYCGPSAPFSNASDRLVFYADNFNTTGSWNYFERNLWTDYAGYFNSNGFEVTEIYFMVQARGTNSRVITLLDDTGFVAAAANGGGFEDQGSHGTQIRGWAMYPDWLFTVTDTMAYAGNKAANMTLLNQGFYHSQLLQERPLNGTRETYLDVMWRLEDYTPSWPNYAYLHIEFDDGHQLFYYLAAYSGALGSNSTWYGFFNVTGVSTTGQWVAMHRDLVHDYQTVFGSLPTTDTIMTYLSLEGSAGPATRLELLLDDVYLYDDPAPRISNVQQSPLAPSVGQPVLVSAHIVDQDLTTRWLHYRLDGGSWNDLAMSSIGGDDYEATIPGQPHNTVVDYYLEANDTWGMVTIALNGSVYWSYTALDQTPPVILNLLQTPTLPSYLTQVNISATILDSDTGLASYVLRYRLNGGGWVQVPMSPTGSPDSYYGLIPVQPWDTLVQYYLNATNTVGLSNVDDNLGSYYAYTVGDFVNPTISNHARVPFVVGYLDVPVITCDVTDAGSGVGTVLIFYRLNGTAWGWGAMTHTTGNQYMVSGGTPLSLGTVAEYYFNASDNAGNWVLDNNGGANYTFTVVDNVAPHILIATPDSGAVVSGSVTIDVQAYDDATSIDHVEFFVDGVQVFTNPTTPFGCTWDSTTVSNGQHTITAIAYDTAGNSANSTITVTTNNPVAPPPIPGFPWPAMVLGGIAAVTVTILRRRRRR
jgi:hypothetical protein